MLSARVGSWTPNLLHLCQTMVTTSYREQAAGVDLSILGRVLLQNEATSCGSLEAADLRADVAAAAVELGWQLSEAFTSSIAPHATLTSSKLRSADINILHLNQNAFSPDWKKKTYFKYFFISCWVLMLTLFAPLTYYLSWWSSCFSQL